jgi:GNAT superfamily N-acetyltransferase
MMETFLDYTIERFTPADIPALCRLSISVWGGSPTPEEFLLKYSHSESRHSFLGFIAKDRSGEPVGFQGVIRADVIFAGESEILGQIVDTLVHPNCAGKGLIAYLAKRTYEFCRDSGIVAVIGFPNQNFFPIMIKKLGFASGCPLDGIVIPIKTLPLETLSLKNNLLRKIYQAYIKLLFGIFNVDAKAPHSFSSEANPVLLRDENILAYKKARGASVIKIKSALIWIKINRGLFIGDFKIESEAEFKSIMRSLKLLCFLAGIKTINFQSMSGSKEHELFKREYQSFESFPYLYFNYKANLPLADLKATFGDIDIF